MPWCITDPEQPSPMPQDPPTRQPSRPGRNPLVDGVVRAERLFQIALILPVSVVVGWLLGVGLDKWLHQHWISMVGLLLGAVAGFIEVFRVVQKNED